MKNIGQSLGEEDKLNYNLLENVAITEHCWKFKCQDLLLMIHSFNSDFGSPSVGNILELTNVCYLVFIPYFLIKKEFNSKITFY